MDAAKIQLSAEERELISDTAWILTKNRIMSAVHQLMLAVLDTQAAHLQQLARLIPEEISQSSPKISRGENYQGLPYVVLDHPRIFGKQSTCAIRTIFWWGNFFSTTLQLEGSWKHAYEKKIVAAYPELCSRTLYAGILHEPWQHHLGTDNYKPVAAFSEAAFGSHICNHPFIKLTAVVSLDDWDQAVIKLGEEFRFLTSFLIT